MNFRICLILFLFTSCIGIWCQETEKKPSQTIYEEFECKISKSVNGKQLLPISVEIKNISDKPVIVLEKNEDRIYKQVTSRISNFGPDIIMHGSLKGAKTSVLAPSESFTVDMDLYEELIYIENINKHFDARFQLNLSVKSERIQYPFLSAEFKLTDYFEEKLLKEIYPEKNEASLFLEIDKKGDVYCQITNNHETPIKIIKPSFRNVTFEVKLLGKKEILQTAKKKSPIKEEAGELPSEIIVKPKESIKVKLNIKIEDLLETYIIDNVFTKPCQFTIKTKYHEFKQGNGVYFLPLEANQVEIKILEQ